MTALRQPPGTPVGGQFAPGARPAPAGVALAERPELPAPVSLPGEQMISALTTERDPFGIGVDALEKSRGIHIYYADDDSAAIGVNITPNGTAHLFEYDRDDADFEYPYLSPHGRTHPLAARAKLIERLGVRDDIAALTARAELATPEEIARLAEAYEEIHAGAEHDVTAAAYDHWFVALNNGATPRHNEIEGGQIHRAGAAVKSDPDGLAARALRDAAWALTHRHEIGDRVLVSDHPGGAGTAGQAGWTQAAYNQMTRPVREVFGDICTMDEDLPARERDI